MRRSAPSLGRLTFFGVGVLASAALTALVLSAVLAACRFTDGLSGGALEDVANPCDADLMGSIANCGACGRACEYADGSFPVCVEGQCQLLCAGAFADCDEAGVNGCEVDTRAAPEHCGVCGHDCLGGACRAGTCQPILLAEGGSAPMHIVVDNTSVYGVNAVGALTRISKDGGALVTLVPGDGVPQSPPPRIAIAGSNLYYTDFGSSADGGAVWKANVDGGGKSLLAPANAPYAIAVASPFVYWSEGNPDAGSPVGAIRRYNVGTKETALVVAQEPGGIQSIVATSASLHWTNRGMPPAFSDGALKRCEGVADASLPCDQETPVSAPGPVGLVSDGNLYFTGTDGVFAWSCSATSCNTRSVAPQQLNPHFLALDNPASTVFWTTADGAIKSVVKAGYPNNNEAVLFQRRGTNPWDIAVDSKAIYWTDLAGVPGRPGTAPALYKLAR